MKRGWRRCLLGLALLGVGLGLAGCQSERPDPHRLAAALTTAIATKDRAGFDTALAGLGADQRSELWANLDQLEQVGFEAAADQRWRVAWRLPGEQGLAWHWLRVEVDCAGSGCRVRTLGQAPGQPTPIWATQPITVHTGDAIAIVGDQASASWVPAAEQARQQLGTAPVGLLRPPGLLVIEAPTDRAGFEAVLAAPATDFSDTGAITWQSDTARPEQTTENAVPRIVINPDATGGLPPAGRSLLLAHEGVHVATSWLGPPVAGREWVAEGLAEAVSLPLSADEQARSAAHLAQRCPLAQIPADTEFSDPGAVLGAYAWSGWAIDQLLATSQADAEIRSLWTEPDAEPPDFVAPAGFCD